MGFEFIERLSDSPYVETITHGWTVGTGSMIRPAECHWHMVFTKVDGCVFSFFVAPLTASGIVKYTEGAEILWIKFKLGTFMPHLPARKFLDKETILPEASNNGFWLKSAAWQLPDFENTDTFINRLVHDEILVHDPIVDAALEAPLPDVSPRTIRHRFLQATGLSQNQIHQIERARYAAALLSEGMSILDVVFTAGYFDQPHMTRALKQWVGHTPAQLARMAEPV